MRTQLGAGWEGVSLSRSVRSRVRGFYGLAEDWENAVGMHGQAHKCIEAADKEFQDIVSRGDQGSGYTMAEIVSAVVAAAISVVPDGYLEHEALAVKIRSERPLGAEFKQILRDVPANEG